MTGRRGTFSETWSRGLWPSRRELLLAGAIVLIGGLLRCVSPSRMAVEHFDEGVYASNVWFGAEAGFRYPERHLYAPPLLPALLETTILLLGPSHWGTMLPGVLFGGLTVALLWWVGRSWFGPEAGLAAALLAATSDVHILYSRTALTDVPLCFWLLLAVYLAWEALRQSGLRWAVAAGLATGLAWWTKYNGWLPLAITLPALILWLWSNRPPKAHGWQSVGPPLRSTLLQWGLIALTAVIVWSPVWIGLQEHGGYSVVAANHRRYLVGLTGWPVSLMQQYGNHRVLDGWLSWAGLGLAVLLPALLASLGRRFTWNASPEPTDGGPGQTSMLSDAPRGPRFTWNACGVLLLMGSAALCAAGIASAVGTSVLLGVAAATALASPLLPKAVPTTNAAKSRQSELAPWLLTVWFLGLLLATPCYRAYPRLTLPWLISTWLAGGWGVARWWGVFATRAEAPDRVSPRRSGIWALVLMLAGGGIIFGWGHRPGSKSGPAWQGRTGMETMAERIVGEIRQDLSAGARSAPTDASVTEFVVSVYGEPALFFHLRAAGAPAGPVSHLEFAEPSARSTEIPLYLAIGPHALRSPAFAEDWTRHKARFRLVSEFEYRPSDLVALNNYPPDRLAGQDHLPVESVRLYRLKFAQPQREE